MNYSKRIVTIWFSCLLIAAAALLPALASRALADDASAVPAGAANAGARTIAQIVGGKGFTAVLKTDGTVWTWGNNLRGMLGAGYDNRSRPSQIKGLTDVTAISASGYHTLALKKDGTVWAWGQNTYGELGDGTNLDRNAPVQVKTLSNVVAIAAGYYHSVALAADGTVWEWGDDTYGQLGNNKADKQPLPMQVQLPSLITSIASGAYHTLAVAKDGTLWAWGDNTNGELGDGQDQEKVSTPTMVESDVKQAAGGYNFSLALRADGTLLATGLNALGQLGNGSWKERQIFSSTFGPNDYVAVAAGNGFAAALEKDGTVRAWGDNTSGQVGVGAFDDGTQPTRLFPSIVSGLGPAASIGVGYNSVYVVEADGSLWAWGNNVYGQLGDQTTINQSSPIRITSLDAASVPVLQPGDGPTINKNIVSSPLAAGDSNTLAIKGSALYGWGENTYGQLGSVSLLSILSPQRFPLQDVAAIAEGGSHSLSVKNDGTLWTWGSNYFGQLGDGTTTNRNTAVQVPGLMGVVAATAGTNHSVALLNNGTVWTFGDNTYGQLAVNDYLKEAHSAPSAVAALHNIIAIAAGGNFSLALQDNGTVWAWGDNADGQLGNGTNVGANQPVQVTNLTNVIAIAAGKDHAAAVKSDGSIWLWGYNAFGQLGTGDTVLHNAPVTIGMMNDVKAVAAGAYHTLAIRSNGTVWAWGYDSFGQLGDGGTANQLSPVQVTGLTHATAIAAGAFHSAAMANDNTVWTWGGNFSGQVGDGTRTNRSVPAMVTGMSASFTDIASHWAKISILRAAEAGYVDGYNDGSFQPERSVSRAEYLKMTAAAQHMTTAAATAQQAWYEPYAAALRQAGALQDGDLSGDYNAPISRGELAAIALRAVQPELRQPNTALSSAYVLQTAVRAGLLQGLAGGELAPQAETTRAQAVTLIERMLTLLRGGKLPVDEQAAQQAAKLAVTSP